MKYEVKFTNQFKKDLNWRRNRIKIWISCTRLSVSLLTEVRWMQGTGIMICPVIIREQENVTLNRTGFWYMKSGMKCLFFCYTASERMRNCLRNKRIKQQVYPTPV